MEELSIRSGGVVTYPVRNRTDTYEMDCGIRFSVNIQAGIADEAAYQKAAAGSDPVKYIKDNLPRFMTEAMHAAWKGAIPIRDFNGFLQPMQPALSRILGTELAGFGLRLSAFSLQSGLNEEHEKALRAHDAPPSAEEMEAIRKNMIVDEQYRPERVGTGPMMPPFSMRDVPAAPAAAPKKFAPWTCGECGAKDLTGNFCPDCGASRALSAVWRCGACGAEGLTGKFCPDCGAPRPK